MHSGVLHGLRPICLRALDLLLEGVSARAEHEVTFHLKAQQSGQSNHTRTWHMSASRTLHAGVWSIAETIFPNAVRAFRRRLLMSATLHYFTPVTYKNKIQSRIELSQLTTNTQSPSYTHTQLSILITTQNPPSCLSQTSTANTSSELLPSSHT
jgi:hypothetical protein